MDLFLQNFKNLKLISVIDFFIFFQFIAFGCKTTQKSEDKLAFVNSYIGTAGAADAGYGGVMPCIAPPFAMTQWTAMTRECQIGKTSYHYNDSNLIGFIGTHQPAIWMGDYGSISFLPSIGEIKINADDRKQKFSHQNEKVSPQYYSVIAETNENKKIRTEIAATTRCAIFNIYFPEGSDNHIFIEASRKISDKKEFEGFLKIIPEQNEIIGYNSDRFSHELGPDLPNFKGYFVIKFSKGFGEFGTWINNELNKTSKEVKGDHVGGFVYFTCSANEKVQIKIATSFISIEQARENLEKEIPDWDFEKTVSSTVEEWNSYLDRVSVEGGSDDQKTCFYTALYHTLQYPRIFSEYGKYYSAFDDKIHSGESYNDYSLWDTFRAQHPWLTIIAPEKVSPMVKSLLQMFDEGGWMPKWPNPTYTNIMIGTHADAVVADAITKGLVDYDVNKAWDAVYKDAMTAPDGDTKKTWGDRDPWTSYEARGGLTWYKEKGYVPSDKTLESVSRTLEFAYDDYCVAQVAKYLHKDQDYKYFMGRAKNYHNVFNKATGFMQAKLYNGQWASDSVNNIQWKGPFTEGSKWTYLFCVMQDVPGFIDLIGGKEKFIQKLDQNFDGNFYVHANEPGHHYIYLYDYAGQPWKTQEKIWEHSFKNYKNAPNGLIENDDCGQMSAWLIFSSMGFYPVCPGSGEYAIGVPLFSKITLNLPAPYNNRITISAKGFSSENKYIKSVTIDGKPLLKPFISHAELVKCDDLVFEMTDKPSTWGNN